MTGAGCPLARISSTAFDRNVPQIRVGLRTLKKGRDHANQTDIRRGSQDNGRVQVKDSAIISSVERMEGGTFYIHLDGRPVRMSS